MTPAELVQILKNHKAWLAGKGGARANLALRTSPGSRCPDSSCPKPR